MSSTQAHMGLNYRPDIDGLRAIAVSWVVAHHAFPKEFPGGFIGVDIFFVISGFLITGIILNGLKRDTFSLTDFFVRRIKRIFPSLVFVLACCYALGWHLMPPPQFADLGSHLVASTIFMPNIWLFSRAGYFDSASELKPLLHLWSLGIEEQFYLIWPLFLIWVTRRKGHIKAVIAVTILGSFLLNMWWTWVDRDAAFYLPMPRFWELLIGASLAVLMTGSKKTALFKPQLGNILASIGVLSFVIGMFLINPTRHFPGAWALLPTVGAALVIAAGPNNTVSRNLLAQPVLVWIGLISYPLYLWHWPAIAFLKAATGLAPETWQVGLTVPASIGLAWISYRVVETPIRFSKLSKTAVFSLCTAMLTLLVVGRITALRSGLPFRLPGEIRRLSEVKFTEADIMDEWRIHKCFLMKGDGPDQLDPSCLEDKPDLQVVLWGDSHAAALAPGLRSLQKEKPFALVQTTISACAPILGQDSHHHPQCREINDRVFEYIKSHSSDVVIIGAFWPTEQYRWQNIVTTILELKRIGVPKIILVGPNQGWGVPLPTLVVDHYRKFGMPVLRRSHYGLSNTENIAANDRDLAQLAADHGIHYVSLVKNLCNEDGCLIRLGDEPGDLMSFDTGHLSPRASTYLVKLAVAPLF